MTTNAKRSIELLQDPALNKSTAFTEQEKPTWVMQDIQEITHALQID